MTYQLLKMIDFHRDSGPRPDWATFWMEIAMSWRGRGNCTRRLVGAVIVNGNEFVQGGYNGAPPGEPGCLTDGACPRGRHHAVYDDDTFATSWCACGNPWPCTRSAQPGEGYDTPEGKCGAVHAEANALIRADFHRCRDATMFITEHPCWNCSLLIRAARISRVVIP